MLPLLISEIIVRIISRLEWKYILLLLNRDTIIYVVVDDTLTPSSLGGIPTILRGARLAHARNKIF